MKIGLIDLEDRLTGPNMYEIMISGGKMEEITMMNYLARSPRTKN